MPLGAADRPLPAPDARPSMPRSARRTGAIAAVLLALATALGALESHLLKSHFTAQQDAIFRTALQYQFLQSLGLLALAALLQRLDSRSLLWAARLLCVGIVLFSGSLYLLVFGAPRLIGAATPLGGLALIGAWLLVAAALLRSAASQR